MARWGAAQWMSNPPVLPDTSPSTTTPYYYADLCYPLNGAQNVPRSTVLRVVLVSPATPVSVSSVTMDGVAVAPGTPLGAPYGYMLTNFGGRYCLEVYVRTPFEENSAHVFEVVFTDGLDSFAYKSSFRVARDQTLYYGTSANALEQLVVTPCTRFLALEPVRQRLLQVALVESSTNSAYRDNLAARVLYQIAYDTELSALLNPYHTPDNTALTSIVRARRSVMDIEAAMQPYERAIEIGFESLFKLGGLPSSYKHGLADARDSLLYTYRASSAVVAVFLARALEHASTQP